MRQTQLAAPLVPARNAAVEIRDLEKSFGDRVVLSGVHLHIHPGELVAVVGRSGCGKTTLLRIVAGLETPTGGTVAIDGAIGRGLAHDTRMVFQDARLLPWKSVGDNVALGALAEGEGDRVAQVAAALARVGLQGRAGDWPAALSGGQRQRVALARALVSRPRLLLLDEPLGALDAFTRVEMQQLIERIWLDAGFSAVIVTHDVEEAVALADRVIALDAGRVALDVEIALPRPRQRHGAAFVRLVQQILEHLTRGPVQDQIA
jgi:sulfonate transport system ATP-binding protein